MTTMKKGDRLPALSITCTSNDAAVDLTSATSVLIIGKLDGATDTLFEREATSADALGVATMDWEVGDTDTVGRLLLSVKVTIGGKSQHFPANNYLAIDIEDTLE